MSLVSIATELRERFRYEPRYFTPREVSRCDVLVRPIIEAAGRDISHWFNPKTGDHFLEMAELFSIISMCARSPVFHVLAKISRETHGWVNNFGRPWWKDTTYQIGILSLKTRFIHIINTFNSQEQMLEVCSKETILEILECYLAYNGHAASYTWKFCGVPLDMDKTLQENGVQDQDLEFEELKMDSDLYTPNIHLYFNDDLTVLR
ncbi:cytochrome b5 domain-containing protein 1 [Xenopus laevis]|uniref:Cytochrome b5 domain-containing protein 1 n=1 Tax=Xenopus laevis TaxID=8355 RepID=A0A8J0U1R3_XENLA|nr:cytochrome b5 domain-containing protein 1 [Xenopus laevis]